MAVGGKFESQDYTAQQLTEIGKTFWTSFIAKRSEHLKETLKKAYQIKMS